MVRPIRIRKNEESGLFAVSINGIVAHHSLTAHEAFDYVQGGPNRPDMSDYDTHQSWYELQHLNSKRRRHRNKYAPGSHYVRHDPYAERDHEAEAFYIHGHHLWSE